jgi:hypothetical protein
VQPDIQGGFMGASRFIVMALGTVLICAGCGGQPVLRGKPGDKLEISDFIGAVQKAINSEMGDPAVVAGLPISSVSLVLQTTHENKVAGEVDYLVAVVKGYYDKSDSEQVTLKLTPTKPKFVTQDFNPAQSPTDKITASLQQLIKDARASIEKSYGADKQELYTSQVDVQLQFQVTYDFAGGVQKWELLPVTVGATDEYTLKTTDTVTVSFAVPQPAK